MQLVNNRLKILQLGKFSNQDCSHMAAVQRKENPLYLKRNPLYVFIHCMAAAASESAAVIGRK